MSMSSGREGALPTGDPTWNYVPPSGRFDEFRDSNGEVRPGWMAFWEGLRSLDPVVLSQREE